MVIMILIFKFVLELSPVWHDHPPCDRQHPEEQVDKEGSRCSPQQVGQWSP